MSCSAHCKQRPIKKKREHIHNIFFFFWKFNEKFNANVKRGNTHTYMKIYKKNKILEKLNEQRLHHWIGDIQKRVKLKSVNVAAVVPNGINKWTLVFGFNWLQLQPGFYSQPKWQENETKTWERNGEEKHPFERWLKWTKEFNKIIQMNRIWA